MEKCPSTSTAEGRQETAKLILFVLGGTYASEEAITNLTTVAEHYLSGRYTLEIVDVRNEPFRAIREGALIVPTLIVNTRKGNRKVVGDLSDSGAILKALGLSMSEQRSHSEQTGEGRDAGD